MIRRLVFTYVTITALALAMLAIPLGITFANREKDRLLFDIERDADTMSSLVEGSIAAGKPVPSADILRYAKTTGGHVIVVDRHGIALLDTDRPKHPGTNYLTDSRPEIKRALAGQHDEGTRRSETAGTTLVYAAVPTSVNGRVNGAVRITYPTATLNARVRKAWGRLALLCVGVLVVVALVGFFLARSVTRPVRRLEDTADRFASGDLDARVATDIGPPEIRRLADTFNRTAERLAALIGAQQRFVADASHQLRTPLTALRLRLENLDAHVAEPDRVAIEAAAEEVARMSRLVEGLLVLARDEATSGAHDTIDVAAVVRERAEIWSDVASERNVRIAVDAPARATASAAPGAVEQLIDNLVDNALNASPANTTITIRVDAGPSTVALHVLDQGSGLDDTSRARAFDRFWRAPGAAPGGSGLGLAIVRQLAEASHGSARLDRRATGGLDAVIELPAKTAPAPSLATR
ncbi:MAG TPA: ATP-binding protein [Acidimicrobiia bacterium]|nr:ATP-binding protein [Acidimicrobiia bacterium]